MFEILFLFTVHILSHFCVIPRPIILSSLSVRSKRSAVNRVQLRHSCFVCNCSGKNEMRCYYLVYFNKRMIQTFGVAEGGGGGGGE